ncbi:MAG: hypothetical protein D3918_04580, partial [Candidatus Electrothrix sp. AX2]|nr:hypothetical protein [Candidatus Electrothrix gigas]
MKDNELRGLVLQYFYDNRRKRSVREPKAADLGVEVTEQDILHICDQLGQHDLLDWKSNESRRKSSDTFLPSTGKINAFGIDVVEGNATRHKTESAHTVITPL